MSLDIVQHYYQIRSIEIQPIIINRDIRNIESIQNMTIQ